MKRLILSALVLGAATQAAGCIIVSDDDPVGTADVGWALLTADGNGNPVAANCPAGANTAKVFSLRDGDDVGDAFIDKFDCQAEAGIVSDLPTGNYLIWVQLTDDAETTLFAESGSIQAVIADGATTVVDHSIYVDHAFFNVSWTLNAAGTRAACADVPEEDGVAIVASTPGGGLIDTVVDCEVGDDPAIATTDPLPINMEWSVNLELLNAAQQSIGESDLIVHNPDRPLNYGNRIEDLGTHEIVLQ